MQITAKPTRRAMEVFKTVTVLLLVTSTLPSKSFLSIEACKRVHGIASTTSKFVQNLQLHIDLLSRIDMTTGDGGWRVSPYAGDWNQSGFWDLCT